MHKFIYILIVLLLLTTAACTAQTTPLENTASPTSQPATEKSPAVIPTPTAPPGETTPPAITSSHLYPLIVASSDPFNQVVSIDPGDAGRIAHCAPGEIRVSQDSGQTWESISTVGVAAAAQEHGYELFYGEPWPEDACLSVTLDPQIPQAYYAVFTAAIEEYGAPPLFYMGFFTADGGESWQFVDPPENSTIEDFGGFWNLGAGTVQALFFPAGSLSEEPAEILITETADGGNEWQSGELICPAVGPCLRWGPAPSNIPGMGSPLPQPIFFSQDNGETWSVIDPPAELRGPAPNQLVARSDSQVLIISGGISLSEEVPVFRASNDSGFSWQPVEVPPLSTDEMNADYFPGLQYLANHSYISQAPEGSTWYWLDPDLPIWCPVNTDRLPVYPVELRGAGDQVWWVNHETQQAEYISLSELTCAVE